MAGQIAHLSTALLVDSLLSAPEHSFSALRRRLLLAGRGLQQFLSQNFCPDGCADDGCIQDATRGGLRCQKCQAGLVVDLVTGNCACPAGKYASAADPPACTDCPKGSYWCVELLVFWPA